MNILRQTPSLVASLLSLAVLTTTVVGCDNDSQDHTAESDGNDPDPGNGPPEPGTTEPGNGEPQADLDYTGTWTLSADYEVYCEYFANKNQESRSVTESITLTGDNADLVADIHFFQLTGAGNSDRLNLSGSFPLMGIDKVALSGTDNRVAFTGNEVSKDLVSGDLSGTFDEANGAHCEIIDGSFEMTR